MGNHLNLVVCGGAERDDLHGKAGEMVAGGNCGNGGKVVYCGKLQNVDHIAHRPCLPGLLSLRNVSVRIS